MSAFPSTIGSLPDFGLAPGWLPDFGLAPGSLPARSWLFAFAPDLFLILGVESRFGSGLGKEIYDFR